MDYQFSAESGVQFLARLNSRPSLHHLDDILFPEGPNPGNVIQISGETSTGKTLLLLKFMTKCILPPSFNEFEIGGLGAGVILIDTDHHFSIVKLVHFMETFIKARQYDVSSNGITGKKMNSVTSLNPAIIEKMIKESLTKLIILKTFSSSQFQLNIELLKKILLSNSSVSLLLIDSISSYYWEDSTSVNNIKKIDLYLKNICTRIQKNIQEHKIVIMYTKPESFQSKYSENKLSINNNLGQINYRIELRRNEVNGQDLYSASVETQISKTCYNYSIGSDGFKWIIH